VSIGRAAGFDIRALANQYQQYRIVGWGARLRASVGITSNGEITGAVLPLKGLLPWTTDAYPSVLNPTGSSRIPPSYYLNAGPVDSLEQYMLSLGVPMTGSGNSSKVDITKLVAIPSHGTMSHSQVAARGAHFRSRPFEPEVATFKRVGFTSTGTDSVDFSLDATGAGAQQYAVDMSPWKLGGWESIVVGGAGYSPNTLIGHIELIYHVEATLNPNIATLHRPAVSPVPSDPALHAAAHRHIAKVPRISFADVVQQGEDYVLGSIEGAASDFAQRGLASLSGVLTRAIGFA